jgi:hypothetical protein
MKTLILTLAVIGTAAAFGQSDPPLHQRRSLHCEYISDAIECNPSTPIDVPAVRLKDTTSTSGDLPDPAFGKKFCEDMGGTMRDRQCVYTWRHWSCADKTRILLTSEDGKHWCHKVQP